MDPFGPIQLIAIFLVFVRVGAMMVAAPFFSHKSFPIHLRVFFAVFFAYLLVGFIPASPPASVLTPVGLSVALAVETLTGLALGFSARFVFWGVAYAADVLGFQMGLAMAQVFNPADGQQTNPMGQFIAMLFLLVFVLMDGPHFVLHALVASFETIPLAEARLEATGPVMLGWAGGIFMTGLRLASPFMVTFFLVETALGIFARVVPQADLFTLSLPLKLLVGMGITYLFIPNLLPVVPGLIDEMFSDMADLISALAG